MALTLYGCRSITSECPSAERLRAASLFSGIKHCIRARRYTWNLADSITSLQRTHERGYSPSPNVFTGMWEENLISRYAPRQRVTSVISMLGSREEQSMFTVRGLQWQCVSNISLRFAWTPSIVLHKRHNGMHLNEGDILRKGKAIEKLKVFAIRRQEYKKTLLTVTLKDFPGDEFYQWIDTAEISAVWDL